MTNELDRIVALIKDSHTVLITSHEGPDGDAVGSSLGLAAFLRRIGKQVVVHLADPVPELYRFLPGAESVLSHIPHQDYDLAFVLDVGSKKRAGSHFAACSTIQTVINLDHHATCESFGTINLIDPGAAATGLLVWRILEHYGLDADYATALCLYVAIITDTGSFHYSNANYEAFSVAGTLLEQGGLNAWTVTEKLYESQPQKRLLLLAQALQTLEFMKDGTVGSLTVTLDMYAHTGANAELTDGFVNYPRSVAGVEVAIFFRQLDEETYKVGFRSKGLVNVASLAQSFGGGGHHNAAGGNVKGTLEEVKALVYQAVEAASW